MPAAPPENRSRGFIIPIGGAEGKGKKPSILKRFIELCGGRDARILVIPTASLLNETGPLYKELFESMGANSMCVPIEQREQCFDEETLRILGSATGIFITGGNQLRLSTILGGTPVAQLIRSLNADGVHIAGTSAGAAIVSEHMIAAGRSGSSPGKVALNWRPAWASRTASSSTSISISASVWAVYWLHFPSTLLPAGWGSMKIRPALLGRTATWKWLERVLLPWLTLLS